MITNCSKSDKLRRRDGMALLVTGLGLMLAACTGAGGLDGAAAGRTAALEPEREPWEQPVAKAQCGPDDPVETALQGQVPLVDRVSGRSQQAYACNLELVGQFQGEGASWQHAWYEHCAYFGTANNAEQHNPGTVVIDAFDPANPGPTAYLTEPAMLDPWESLKVNAPRGLLAGVENGGPGFAVYDVATDCTQPVLLSSVDFPGAGHAGNVAPDGLTYYSGNALRAIDMADPANPTLIAELPYFTHDLSASEDGTRLYLASRDPGDIVFYEQPNGLRILDVTSIQERTDAPEALQIGELFWDDGTHAQMTQPIRIDGVPYILFVDELGSAGIGRAQLGCAQGMPPYAFARLIDISDETNPKLVSKLMLETHDPANCPLVIGDSQSALFAYDSHYCTADDPDDASLVACGYFESGLRVFDIRDPYKPREIAYYIPPARLDQQNELPASNHSGLKTADWASSHPRFVLERGEIWFTSQDNGFQVVRFTRPLEELLDGAP